MSESAIGVRVGATASDVPAGPPGGSGTEDGAAPEFPGERFIAEDVVWIRMSFTCKLVFINRPIYVCAYLPGGLTSAGRRNAIRSPRGAMDRAKLLMGEWFRLRIRLKGAALWMAYGRFARKSYVELVRSSGHPALSLLGLIPGAILHARWQRLLADD